MKLPLWIPDGEEGWILSFPGGVYVWYEEDQETPSGMETPRGTEDQVL